MNDGTSFGLVTATEKSTKLFDTIQ